MLKKMDRINFFKKLKTIERKKIVFVVLVAITLIGAWLRLYHFSDWLHFELDQARDVIFVSEGVQHGPFDLPILGPKASGTLLRLGPAFYYMEYASALLFGDTPEGHALFVATLSIVSIPLCYFLFKQVFPITISLGLTYLYATSAYFVLYARFAWNPNILPFFLIAFFYSLLRATNESSQRPGRWFVLSSLIFAIGTQLHFIAFVALPLFMIGFFLYMRPRFSWKAWMLSIMMILLVYVPVLANEWVFQGSNTKAFFVAINKKKSDKSILENITINILEQSKAYALLVSGNDHIFLSRYEFDGLSVKKDCGDHCKKTSSFVAFVTITFFLAGTILLFIFAKKRKGLFLYLSGWYLVLFLVYTLLASELAPRFFLMLMLLPFIFIGILADIFWQRFAILSKIAFVALIFYLSYTNGKVLVTRFDEMGRAETDSIRPSADHIIEEPIRTTLEQERTIARYFADMYRQNGFPVFIYGESFWRRSIKYLTERMGVPVGHLDSETPFLKSNNFIVMRSDKKGDSLMKPYRNAYDFIERKNFGTLTVYVLRVKPEKAIIDDAVIVPMRNLLYGDAGDRVTVKSKENVVPIAESSDAGDVERITWRGVFWKK